MFLLLLCATLMSGCFYHNYNVQGDFLNSSTTLVGNQIITFAPGIRPGIIVQADFNKHHKAGQPYGNWTVRASWRNSRTSQVSSTTVPLDIAPSGQGIATLSNEFLNLLLTQVNAATETYIAEPGLQLEFFPDRDAWAYYSFN